MADLELPPLSHGPYLTEGPEEDGDRRLLAGECAACGKRVFPPPPVCPRCNGEEMNPLVLGRAGRLYSYTVIHQGPAWLKAPYMAVYVDMPEGVRIFSLLAGMDAGDMKCDMPVSLRITEPVTSSDGRRVLAFMFGPAEQG